MATEGKVKPKRTRKSKDEQVKHVCHVNDKCNDNERKSVQKYVCRGLETTKHGDDNHYCLLHLPTKEKDAHNFQRIIDQRFGEVTKNVAEVEALRTEADCEEVKAKFKHDFRYVWFPKEISFFGETFIGDANFSSATFSGDASFGSTIFVGDVDFSSATFEEKSQIFFEGTEFKAAIYFKNTKLNGFVDFQGYHNNRMFVGEKVFLDLRNARIADAKKLSFHTVRLEPSWFINVDASQFVFTDCKWLYADLNTEINVKTEIEHLRNREVSDNPNELLTKACWQLADNYEESKSFHEASLFRQMANESKRLETPWHWQPFTLHWWYWLSSFYGESWKRALLVLLIAVFVGFPITFSYTIFQVSPKTIPLEVVVSKDECEKVFDKLKSDCTCEKIQQGGLAFDDAILHSLSAITFQDVEYRRPISFRAEFWTFLERILIPLQAALLALAIRRRFMR